MQTIDLLFEALLDEKDVHIKVHDYYSINNARLNDQNEKVALMIKVVLKCDWLMTMIAPQYSNFYQQLSKESQVGLPEKYRKFFKEHHYSKKLPKENQKTLKISINASVSPYYKCYFGLTD